MFLSIEPLPDSPVADEGVSEAVGMNIPGKIEPLRTLVGKGEPPSTMVILQGVTPPLPPGLRFLSAT